MTKLLLVITLLLGFGLGVNLLFGQNANGTMLEKGQMLLREKPDGFPVATLAGGCFWCTESEYRALDGVLYTQVGYMGGHIENPTYGDITTGQSGHAEVVQVTFDPSIIGYEDLVRFFLTKAHDPTQLNRQGVDKGTQYRSEIFTHNEEQAEIANRMIQEIDSESVWKDPIVTKVSPAETFWIGEEYHQQYYEKYAKENGKDHIRVILKKAGQL